MNRLNTGNSRSPRFLHFPHSGSFHVADNVTIAPAGGFTVPASAIKGEDVPTVPAGVLPFGTTRNEAQLRLKQLRAESRQPGECKLVDIV